MKHPPLVQYLLHLADNALILGHRNSEWTGHGPILEQDIALSNIALDLIGQARNFYQYAAKLLNQQGETVTEDMLAYLRDGSEYKNHLLVEQPNGDWGNTILRQFFYSSYQYFLYQELKESKDENISAIAEKSLKEIIYHLRWSSEWVIRLGDGTEESHKRMKNALHDLVKYTGELFTSSAYENALITDRITIDPSVLKLKWEEKVNAVLLEAGLLDEFSLTSQNIEMQTGGKEGNHSEHLGAILTEMQFLQRAYPDCEW